MADTPGPNVLARRERIIDHTNRRIEINRLDESLAYDEQRRDRLNAPPVLRHLNDSFIAGHVARRFEPTWPTIAAKLADEARAQPDMTAELIVGLSDTLAYLLVTMGERFAENELGRDPLVLLSRVLSRRHVC